MNREKILTIVCILVIISSGLLVYKSPCIIKSADSANYWHSRGFDDATQFIKYGYPEIKSISIQFLTLLTAILVVSITFSEKVVKYDQADRYARLSLTIGWTALIVAIIFDGIGLALNAYSLPNAIFDVNTNTLANTIKSSNYLSYTVRALFSIILSGIFFILGLVLILNAGILSYRKANSINIAVSD